MAATAAAATSPRRAASGRRAILGLAASGALGIAILFVFDGSSDWDHEPRARAGFVLLAAAIIVALTTAAIVIVSRRFVVPSALPAIRAEPDSKTALLEAALAQISEGLCVVDSQRRLAIVNRRFADMFGIPESWLRSGLRFPEAASLIGITLEDGESFPFPWSPTADGDRPHTLINKLADGRIIEIVSRKVADGGHVITFKDVSERERAKIELDDIKSHVDSAYSAKSDFLANMSHELRTPLNAIIGFTDVMAAEMFGPLGHPNYREYVEDIRASGRHLLLIITEILQMAKVDAGKLELHDEVVDLGAVAHFCRRIVRERATATNLQLALDFPPDLPLLRADERLIRQLLLNLLANAVKFTPRDGSISMSGRLDDAGRLILSVVDTGIGIAADDIPKVLSPFGQVDNVYTRRHGGTGLGLPIVQSYAELHGAEFEIESEPGKGTCVQIKFPPARVLAAGTGPTAEGKSTKENGGP